MPGLPWFMAFDHLPVASGDTSWAVGGAMGDGALTSVENPTSMFNDIVSLSSRKWMGMGGGFGLITKTLPTDQPRLTVGFRFRTDDFEAGAYALRLRNSSGSTIIGLIATADGLAVRVGGVSLATASGMVVGSEYYIEFSTVIDDAVGSYTLKIHGLDGITTLSGSNVDTRGATGDIHDVRWEFVTASTAVQTFVTDLYIRERAADDPQFYGPIVMRILRPAADVQEEWTPLSGDSAVAMVQDSSGSDGDTTYLTSGTLAQRDIYTLGDLPAGVNSVIAVVAVTCARAPDGGAPLVAAGVKIDADVSLDAGKSIGTSQHRTQMTTYMTQPNGSAWSTSSANAAELVVEAA
jgi:hypothetical protein